MTRGAPHLPALVLLAGFAMPVAAHTSLQLEQGLETLDPAGSDWRSTAVSAQYRGTENSAHVQWRRIERFGLDDSQGVAGGSLALGQTLVLAAEINASPDPVLLPRFGAQLDVAARLPAGFVAHVGGRRAEYREDTATSLLAGLEWYLGNWRLAYSLIHGRLDSGESGNAHVGQADFYYGAESSIGVVAATGDEPTRIDPMTVTVVRVRGVTLVGRHWFGERWGVAYSYGRTEQGDYYTRTGGTVGLLFRF